MQFIMTSVLLFVLSVSVIIYGDNKFMESNKQINNESIVRSRRFIDGNTVMNFLKKILNAPAELEQDIIQEGFCTEDEMNSPKQMNFNPKHGKKLTIKFLEDGKCKVIRLKKANHYLANEHLPVWITMKDASSEFHLMHNVSKKKIAFINIKLHYIEINKMVKIYFSDYETTWGIYDVS